MPFPRSLPGLLLPYGLLAAAAAFAQPPAARIEIEPGAPITVDGTRSPGEWDDAAHLQVRLGGEARSMRIDYKHDGTALLFAVSGLSAEPFRVPEILVDTRNDKADRWEPDDFWFHASYSDCWGRGKYNDYDSCKAPGHAAWEASNLVDPGDGGSPFPDAFEFRIPLGSLGLSPRADVIVGLAFGATDTSENWELWPAGAELGEPSSWGTAVIRRAKRAKGA